MRNELGAPFLLGQKASSSRMEGVIGGTPESLLQKVAADTQVNEARSA